MSLTDTVDELEAKLRILIDHHEELKQKSLELKEPIEQIQKEIEDFHLRILEKLKDLEDSKEIIPKLNSGEITDIESLKKHLKTLELTEIYKIQEKLNELEEFDKIIPSLTQDQYDHLNAQQEESELIQQQMDVYREGFWNNRIDNETSLEEEENAIYQLQELDEQEERLQVQMKQLTFLQQQLNSLSIQARQLQRLRQQFILRHHKEVEEQQKKWEELFQPFKEHFWGDISDK